MKIIQPDDGSVSVGVFQKGKSIDGDEDFGEQGLIIFLLGIAPDARFHVELDYINERGRRDMEKWDTEPGQGSVERQREVGAPTPSAGMKAIEVRVSKL